MDTSSAATTRNVEAARESAGVSIPELSSASGIPYVTLYRLLRGQASWKLDQLAAVAASLSVAPADLVAFEEAA